MTTKKKNNPAQFLVDALKRLEYRGYDSWGVAYGEGPELVKKSGRISEIPTTDYRLMTNDSPAYAGVGHTRWATHGGVTDANAHPHLDCTGKLAVVHNGIIENWEELRRELEERGHTFISETDTEVVSHLVEEGIEGVEDLAGFVEVVRQVFNQLEGLNAIVVYYPQLRSIIGFRNGSPMVVGVGPLDPFDSTQGRAEQGRTRDSRSGSPSEYFIASDVPAFLPYTRRVVFLEDGEGVVLTNSPAKGGSQPEAGAPQEHASGGKNQKLKIKILDAKTGKEKPIKIEKIEWDAEEAELGKYPHYLIKEISEQPQVLARMAEYSEKELKDVVKLIKGSFGTYFTACGTAAYSGIAATYLFADLAKRHVNFAVGSEFYFLESFLTPKSLLIAASQSGETMDTLEAVRAAKRHRTKVVALTNVRGSSLTRLADKTLLLNCGPEKAVLATKSYTAKLALFLMLATGMGGKLSAGKKLVAASAKGVRGILAEENTAKIRELAHQLKDIDHLYSIGRGVNYATALEAALKIKEVSYIHAEGFAGGELKHGVIALIEEGLPATPERSDPPASKREASRAGGGRGTPCLVFVAKDKTEASILSNAKELKSRGGFIIGVSPESSAVFDVWLKVPDAGPASPIVNVIPAQLLAYFLAVERGLDPDKPRNLAKSVTVK